MKNLFVPMFLSLAFSWACYAEDAAPAEQALAKTEQNDVTAQSYGSSTTAPTNTAPPNNNNMMAAPQANCTTLPADQQNFSMQLNAGNKTMFCSTFTMDQRRQAMSMMGKTGLNGVKMNADQAVEQVARNNNMMPGATPSQQPAPQKNASGCPVR